MTSSPHPPSSDRRQFIAAAILLSSVIIGLTVFFMVNTADFRPPPGTSGSTNQQLHPAFDEPYGGAKPTRPGDRGGWEQLAVLGLIVVAFGGGAARLVYSSRKARRRRSVVDDGVAQQQADRALDDGGRPADREPTM